MPGAGVDPERLGQKWRKGKGSLGRSFKVRKSQVGCRPQGALWRSQPPRASQRRLSASPHGLHTPCTHLCTHSYTRTPIRTPIRVNLRGHTTLTRPCTRRRRPCTPLYYTHGTHGYTHSDTYASPAHVHLHTYTLHTRYTCYTVRTARTHTLHPAPPHTRTHARVHTHTSHVAALQPLSFFEPPWTPRRGCHRPPAGLVEDSEFAPLPPPHAPAQLLGPACSRSGGAQRR